VNLALSNDAQNFSETFYDHLKGFKPKNRKFDKKKTGQLRRLPDFSKNSIKKKRTITSLDNYVVGQLRRWTITSLDNYVVN